MRKERAALTIGDNVVRVSTEEVGVVVRLDGDSAIVAFPGGKRLVLVSDLDPAPLDPLEQLRMGSFHELDAFTVRLQGRYIQHAYRFDPLAGLTNARIEPQHHQVYVAHRVLSRPRPRMILADEVGLGKTIEAGLIVKELIARRVAERVLVVCPASLQRQWQYELASKFNEEFTILDGDGLRFLGKDGQNPWTKADKVITSLTLVSREERIREVVDAGWDVVVFDEAHRVRRRYGGPNRVYATRAYQLAAELESGVDGLLLLTATPMQLHPYELYSLIELVEPGLFPSFDEYDRRRTSLPVLNQLMQLFKSWEVYSPGERRSRIEGSAHLLAQLGIRPARAFERLSRPEIREQLIEALIQKHPLTEVLIRNRKAQLGWTDRRDARRHPVEATEEEYVAYEQVTSYIRDVYDQAVRHENRAVGFLMVLYQKMLASSSNAIYTSLKKRHARLVELAELAEQEMGDSSANDLAELAEAEEMSEAVARLEEAAIDLELLEWEIGLLDRLLNRLGGLHDSKLRVLITDIVDPLFRDRADEKLVIFTGFLKTQELIAAALRHRGYRVAIFNGSMKLEEKEAAVADFRDRAQVLVTTEAGGEGRNFQFAHIMVNYDLPWNPMRVEQRIGRLDRIGQKKRVLIYNLAVARTVEERVLDVLEYRIQLFRESVGALEPILGKVEADLARIVLEHADRLDEELDIYGRDLEQQIAAARETEEMLGDFILDEASLRRDTVNELRGRQPLATHEDLRATVAAALAFRGGALTRAEEVDEIALSPGLQRILDWRTATTRGLFGPAEALEREEVDFFAMGHELIDRIVALAAQSPAAVTRYVAEDLPAGSVLIELYYELETTGFRSEGRFVRHRVGPDLHVRSERLAAPPRLGTAPAEIEPPTWTDQAIAASRQQLVRELHSLSDEVVAEHERAKEERIERIRRVYEYRERRLEDRIDSEERFLAELMETGTPEQRRVLPARQGRLRKMREELRALPAQRDAEIRAIEEEQVKPSADALAAAVVVGGGP